MDKKLVSILGGTGLVALAWLGGSFYVNQQTAGEIKATVHKAASGCSSKNSTHLSISSFYFHQPDNLNCTWAINVMLIKT
jgi:hypothetical protein